jgi:multimeric flavodoxin WrbA
MKNILILTGSPRHRGNTERLADAFQCGAEAAGNHVVRMSAAEMQIHPCIDCKHCFGTNSCVFADDMQKVYAAMAQADVVAVATPLYFSGCSAQMKLLIDRLHNPLRETFPIKGSVLLAVCEDTDRTAFDSLKTMYHACIDYLKVKDLGVVTVLGVSKAGEISGRPELDEAEKLGHSIG